MKEIYIPREKIIEMMGVFGYQKCRQQKNEYAISFEREKEDPRVTYYFTTGTIITQRHGKNETYRFCSVENLELILQK